MKRLREVTKWGGTHVIRISISDLEDLSLKEGDFVDISILKKEVKK